MWKERLVSNLLIVAVLFVCEVLGSRVGGIFSTIIAWVIPIIGVVAIGSIIMEINPPKLRIEGRGSFFKNVWVYVFLGILTLLINYQFNFVLLWLAVVFFVAGMINLVFAYSSNKNN